MPPPAFPISIDEPIDPVLRPGSPPQTPPDALDALLAAHPPKDALESLLDAYPAESPTTGREFAQEVPPEYGFAAPPGPEPPSDLLGKLAALRKAEQAEEPGKTLGDKMADFLRGHGVALADEDLGAIPVDTLGAAIRGFLETMPGLTAQLLTGTKLAPAEHESALARIMEEVVAFGADPVTIGTGMVGGSAAQAALKKPLAAAATKGLLGRVGTKAAVGGLAGGIGLAGREWIRDPFEQMLETGDVSVLRQLGETLKAGGFGVGIGATGAAMPGKFVGPVVGETAFLGTAGAVAAGRRPQTDDYEHALGVILGLRLSRKVPGLADALYKRASGAKLSPTEAEALGKLPPQQQERVAVVAETTRVRRAEIEGKPPRPVDVVPEPIRVPIPEVEARLQQAHGVRPTSLTQRIGQAATTAWHTVSRSQLHLPNTPEFASANEFFRLLRNIPRASEDAVNRGIAQTLDPLEPPAYKLFERKIIADNMVASLDRGEPLRAGFTDRAQVEAYRTQLDALIAQSPEVQQALEARRTTVTELTTELVEHDLLPKDALANSDAYFHQQVLSRLQLQRLAGGARPRPRTRAFQRGRVRGPESLEQEFDYNTDYIEAETSWMTEARMELAKEKSLREMLSREDVLPLIREQATAAQRDWQEVFDADYAKAGYRVWQPRPGNMFYRAFTIPERIAEMIEKEGFADLKLTADQIGTVLAMGGRRKQYVVREEVAQQLDATDKPKPLHPLDTLAREPMRMWKAYILLNPERFIPYNLRNLTGDLDAKIAGKPSLPKEPGTVARDLHAFHYGKMPVAGRLAEARDLAVIGSSLTPAEIPALKDLWAFKKYYGAVRRLKGAPRRMQEAPLKAIEGWFTHVQRFTQFREDLLRYDAYRDYLGDLEAGTLTDYGGAKKEVVDRLAKEMGNDVAAAHLARNLMGDYDNLSVAGNVLRAYLVPFWSWIEINTRRYPRFALNAVEAGKLKGKDNAWAKAVYTGLALSRIGWMSSILWAWNNLVHPDEEKDLGRYDRANPHINLGRNADGSVRVFRNVGALGDFMEFGGINDLISLYPQWAEGQITGEDIVKEMAKAPLNKLVLALRPDLKSGFEVVTAQSLFPDVTQPRTVERGQAAAGVLGLEDEYRQFKGWWLEDGSRARPHYGQRYFMGVTDPRRNALYEIYDLREKFLRQQGKDVPNFRGLSPFRNMREAAMADNYEAFREARRAYLKSGKTHKNFVASLERLDPIAARLNEWDEKLFEHKFLNSIQRGKLRKARDFAQELRVTLWKWYGDAARDDDPLASLLRSVTP